MTQRAPISLEELLQKAKAASEPPKVAFLSKEERAKRALEARAKEVEAKKEREAADRAQKLAYLNQVLVVVDRVTEDRGRGSDRASWKSSSDSYKDGDDRRRSRNYNGRNDERSDGRDSRRQRDRDSGHETSENSSALKRRVEAPEDEALKVAHGQHLKEEDIQSIRERYMGLTDRVKKKPRKVSDKKFVFDWSVEEDTYKESELLALRGQNGGALGRHIGGMDETIEGKERAAIYKSVLQARGDSSVDAMDIIPKVKERKSTGDVGLHWSEKQLIDMTERDWRIFKEDFDISTRGGNIPLPIRSWKESTIPQKILDVISSVGYKEPSPIQRQAIPIGMQNRDILGVAETGSGKTAAFVIPMLAFISQLPRLTSDNYHLGPYALILAPTRELVQQIEQETVKFARGMNFTAVSIVGGHTIGEQAFSLRDGAHIIIATPGRLRDMIDRRILVLSQCTYIVLDEADRMIDLGFEDDVNFILDQLPLSNLKPDSEDAEDISILQRQLGNDRIFRQTVMFSATMPSAVEKLSKKYLRRPATVTIGQAGKVVDRIVQKVEMLSGDSQKRKRLEEILSSGEFEPPIIIFVNQKKTCDLLAKAVDRLGYRSATLHGGKSQDQRELALSLLKTGKKDMLVATDVAGRGIDIKNVSLVINFDMAKNIEDYTHRIGRTGRAGQRGTAITFLSNEDTDVMYDLKQALLKSPNSIVPAELSKHEAAQTRGGKLSKRDETITM